MTVQELVSRFPEIPADLHGELLLAAFADAFEDQLEIAHKPSACAVEHDAGNHFYLQLIGPIDIYRYGLYDRKRVLEEIGRLVDGHRAEGLLQGVQVLGGVALGCQGCRLVVLLDAKKTMAPEAVEAS